ncbi:MAG: deoxyhypusine synthase [Candidatus Thorarchaeota archaeon]
MERVSHIDLGDITSVSDLVKSMNDVGVLGAGRLGRAAAIVSKLFNETDYLTYLSMSGPMVPGGLRKIVSHLVRDGYIDVIITSGANIVHDLVEAYGGAHYRVPSHKDDSELRAAGMGRIADLYVQEKDFETFESQIYSFLDSLSVEERTTFSPSEFLTKLGSTIEDEESIVFQATRKKVPIFSPGLMDSMLGFHMYTYSTTNKLSLDFVKDLRILGEIVTNSRKTGAIMLGGGLSKHFTMGSTILKGGLDLAVQITLDRPEGGSLGGAPLEEGVSWQKVQTEASFESVIGDATIIFPLLILAALGG